MTASAHCTIAARMACLGDATAFVEAFCAGHGIGHADAMFLVLVVEELFTNTVTHGHGGDSDAPVRIDLEARTAEVELRYEDRAPAFDVLAARVPDRPDEPLDKLSPGGEGLHLVRALADHARYAREEGCNRTWIVLRRRA